MRLPIVCTLLMATVLGGCGVSDTGVPQGTDRTTVMATERAATSAVATLTFDQATFQEQMDRLSNEATIVAATAVALRLDPSADSAIVTAVARHYQDSSATYSALQPTLMALTTDLAAPQISDTAYAAARAANGVDAAIAVTNATNMTPLPGQSGDEVALMQELTVVAATMVALNSGAPVEPAVATAATRRYQNAIATMTAPQPAPQPTPPPVHPAPTETLPEPPELPPDLQTLPSAPAPGSLAGATLPVTRDEVEAVLGRLPASIAGWERRGPAPRGSESGILGLLFGEYVLENGYRGPRLRVSAQDQAGMPPGWTAAHAAVGAAQHLGRVEAVGRDSQLVWARVTEDVRSNPPGLPELTLLLGDEAGTWLFTLTAPTTEELDALVAAFADAL